MHYDVFRSITRLQTILLHSIHCKHQFRRCNARSFGIEGKDGVLIVSLYANITILRNSTRDLIRREEEIEKNSLIDSRQSLEHSFPLAFFLFSF